ncbi:hypothetical protein C8J56DRAFT_1053607 [Mycena floridula]|nr:hypothetical protein C8J56DRAFT_1053607 [Mycena floridula]
MLGMFYWDYDHKSMAELDESLDALAARGPCPSKLACDLRWTLHHKGHHRFTIPLFQNVTHLELYSSECFRNFNTKHLHALTNLAYLSLILLNGSTDPVVKLLQKLSLADSILVCIYSPYFLYLDDLESIRFLSKDPRLVLAVDPGRLDESDSRSETILWRPLSDPDHFIRQWGRQLDGEEEMDMWEAAEAIVKVQRALQIAGRPFF